MARRNRLFVGLVAAAALALSACWTSSSPSDAPGSMDTGTTPDGTAEDPDGAVAEDSESRSDTPDAPDAVPPDVERDGMADSGPSGLDLIHRPPECSPSVQTCSLTFPTNMQSGLKAQLLRGTSGVQGETVVFKIESGANRASLGSNEVKTGPMGRAGVQFTTESSTGTVRVRASVKKASKVEPIFWDITIQ